jgi:hypothetical protein
MIDDARAGSIRQPGKSLIDGPMGTSPVVENLKAAIIQYVGERMDAQYLGNKLATDRGKIVDGLRNDAVLGGDAFAGTPCRFAGKIG